MLTPTSGLGVPGVNASLLSASFNTGTPLKASFATASGFTAPLVFLRVKIPLKGLEAITTTVQVPRDMYLADVLDLICRKKFLDNPKEWVLTVPDRGLVVPLDRTVESLQGVHHLALAKRSSMPNSAYTSANKAAMANTNPNGERLVHACTCRSLKPLYLASIFKHLSEPPGPRYVTAADLNVNNYRVCYAP